MTKPEELHRVVLELDDDDFRDFHEAIAKYQANPLRRETMPNGPGPLLGLIVGEIMRGWVENVA